MEAHQRGVPLCRWGVHGDSFHLDNGQFREHIREAARMRCKHCGGEIFQRDYVQHGKRIRYWLHYSSGEKAVHSYCNYPSKEKAEPEDEVKG